MTESSSSAAPNQVPDPVHAGAQKRLFAEALSKLAPTLHRYARSLSRSSDEADDLLQDTLERAWRAREQFDPALDLRRWLVVIMRNRFYDIVRANRKIIQDTDGKHAARLSIMPTQLFRLELKGLLNAIDELPTLYREAAHTVLLQNMGYKAGAALIDCPVPTLKSRVQRARRMLHQAS